MARFTLPRDIYHGKGALDALKTFDGKKPYSFLKSMLTYAVRPKVTYAGKAVKLEKEVFSEPVTAVRSVMYVPD